MRSYRHKSETLHEHVVIERGARDFANVRLLMTRPDERCLLVTGASRRPDVILPKYKAII